MSRTKVWSLVFAIIVILVAAQVANAADCSSLVAGRKYAQQFGGFLNVGALLPNAGGGYWQFNANGTFTGSVTFAVGTMFHFVDMPIAGTYSLAWDPATQVCAGVAHEEEMDQNFQLLVNGDGASIEFMHSDMGLIAGFTAFPLHTGKCKRETLAGTYSYNAKGWIVPPPPETLPPPPPGVPPFPMPKVAGMVPLAFSGGIKFDGAGNFTGSDLVSLVGLVLPRTFTGTYTVGANCVATMTLQDSIGNPPIHTEVFILQKAKAIQVINTDPGTVLAFTANKAVED